MATYPIKMLRDEDKQAFVPFTNAAAVVDKDNKSLQELMDSGKYKIQNNVTTSSAGKGVLDAYQGKVLNDKFNNYVPLSQKGVANGVATLDAEGKVPSAQLPSYVDDVIESYIVSGSTALSAGWLSKTDGGTALTPEKGKIYLIMTSGSYQNKQYRWGGSTYVLCNPSDVNSVNGMTGVVTLKTLTLKTAAGASNTVNATFNAGTDKTVTINIPTKTSHITNDSGFITSSASITGNAATATKLQTGRKINAVVFDGTRDITITANPTDNNIPASDLNDVKEQGFYHAGGGNLCVNKPGNVDTFGLICYKTADNFRTQDLIEGNTNPGKRWTRQFADETWSSWEQIYTSKYPQPSVAKLTTARAIDGVTFDGSADISHYGTCSTAAATAAKTVACTGFKLVTGAIIYVRFTVTNTADVANLTLNVNNTGAKAMKYRNGNIWSAEALAANRVYCFVYDGACYQFVGDRNSNDNTYDRVKNSQNITAGTTAIVQGNLIVAASNGTYTHLKLGNAFNINYPILYAGASVNANATTNNTYFCVPFPIATTQSITLVVGKAVYIKGILNGITFTPVSATPLTQTEPTTADGYEYLYLGTAYSTTRLYLEPYHPIYAYTGNKFTRINGREITGLSVSGKTITYTRADNTTGTITTQDTVYTLPTASSTTLGGIKLGTGLTIKDGIVSVTGSATADSVEWAAVKNAPTAVSYWTNDAGYIKASNTMKGATSSTAGSAGTVPAPAAGKEAQFLRGDGTWAVPSYATSAGSATKATQDGNGKVIANTYLPLTGGTMSNTNVVTNLNADCVDGVHAGRLLRSLGRSDVSTTSIDLNNIVTLGYGTLEIRTPEITTTNCPITGFGVLTNLFSKENYGKMQILGAADKFYMRAVQDSGNTISETWRELIHSGNIASQTVSAATKLNAPDKRNSLKPVDFEGKALTIKFSSKGGLDGSTSNSEWTDVIGLNSWGDTGGGLTNALAFSRTKQKIYHYYGTYGASTWSGNKEIAYTNDSSSGYVLKTGDTMTGELDIKACPTNGGQIRLYNGSNTSTYASIIRNDGNSTYILLTNANDVTGTWNSLRPFIINNSNGYVTMNNGVCSGSTTDSTSTTTGGLISSGGLGVAKAINAGTSITAGSYIKSASGVVNFKDKVNIQYNSTDDCIEFIFR